MIVSTERWLRRHGAGCFSWRMSLISSQRYSAQKTRDVVRHIGRLAAADRRNELRTTSLLPRYKAISPGTPYLHPREILHTYSLQSIEWRRGGRRIEPVPIGPRKVGSIARGDLLDALLDARLCRSQLRLGNNIFDVAGAVSAGMS
jgi:hypothetical protein